MVDGLAQDQQLSGRVVVITGTSPNIGGGIAEALAAAGAAVVAVDANPANAAACADAIIALGGRAMGVTCDVTDEAQVAAAIARAINTFGAIDILVNNAAIFTRKGIRTMTLAEWRRQSSIMLDGAFLFTKYAAEHMTAARKGVIINIISTAGHQGEPGNIAYSTCKAGLLNFTRSAAMEFAAAGIRVVSLTPTATAFHEMEERARRWGLDVSPPPGAHEIMDQFAQRIPLQKLPKPSDYGAAAVFLASDAAAFITGTDLRVDAGAVGRYWAWDPSSQNREGPP